MADMGMTDKQFNGFVRFLLDALKDAMEEKLTKIADNLQKTLEDYQSYCPAACSGAFALWCF